MVWSAFCISLLIMFSSLERVLEWSAVRVATVVVLCIVSNESFRSKVVLFMVLFAEVCFTECFFLRPAEY